MATGLSTPGTTSPMKQGGEALGCYAEYIEEPEFDPPRLLLPSVCRRPTAGSLLLVLLRSDLPGVGTGCRGHRCGRERRNQLRNDFVDMTPSVTDNKPNVYLT